MNINSRSQTAPQPLALGPRKEATGVAPALDVRPIPSALPPLISSEVVAPTKFSVSPEKCCQVLAIAVLCFTFAGSVIQFFKYVLAHDYLLGLFPLFNLNSEISIPAWYSSVTLLLCSLLLAVIFFAKRKNEDRFALHWAVLSLIFLYLSMDEGAHIHETIGTTLNLRLTGITHGFIHYTWVIYGIALVVIVASGYLKFLAHLPRKTSSLFILAGFIYVAGALGMEMVNGRYFELHGSQNFRYQMMTVAEEFLEMAGIVIFIYALLSYIGSQVRTVSIDIERKTLPVQKSAETS